MPDRYGDEPGEDLSRDEIARRARQARERARLDGIAACALCNDDGYIGAMVCDHVDHAEAAKRGMAMIRATMGWDR